MRCRLINVVVLLLVCGSAMALESDRQQPIYIESDELEVDDLSGISEYRGSVRLTQGSILFQADKVIVFKQARQLQKVVAYGGPVRLRQKMEADKGEMRAEAQQMEYLPESDRLFLQGDARLWQGGSEFSGERIEYQLKNEVVVARGDKKQDGRVHIVIQPKNEAGKSAPATAGAEQP